MECLSSLSLNEECTVFHLLVPIGDRFISRSWSLTDLVGCKFDLRTPPTSVVQLLVCLSLGPERR